MKVPLTIGDYLSRGARCYGDRPAVFDEPGMPGSFGTSPTGARGPGPGDGAGPRRAGRRITGERVAIVSPNAARFLIAYFGVSGYGRVLVPVNYRLNADEISYIIEHSGASVLLVDPESEANLRRRQRQAPDRARRRGRRRAVRAGSRTGPSPRPWTPDEDATASINYTSGTTARPKGVQLTHRNCWLNAATFGWHTTVTDRDVFMHTLPMFHCNGWGMPYAVTGMGVPQVVVRKIDGEEILRRIDAHGVTLLCGAPAVVAASSTPPPPAAPTGEEIPGAGTGPHRGRRRPAAV